MERFEMPIVEVIVLRAEDVITASPMEPPMDGFCLLIRFVFVFAGILYLRKGVFYGWVRVSPC